MKSAKNIILSLIDGIGITINGPNPYDPQVNNEKFYERVLRQGTLGLGESYMDGWWDCAQLDQFFTIVLNTDLDSRMKYDLATMSKLALSFVLNAGRKSKAFEVGQKHYDKGNDLYRAMLDKQMTYTCGYWPHANNLDEAQEAKLDLVCRKIGLRNGQRVLDIGSGWGSFIGFAAEKYGVKAVGITVSKEQKELADTLYKDLPVETRLQDYRDVKEKFDHVVSLGMFEHVGYKNYRTYMQTVHNALKDDGLFLLHTIGSPQSMTKNEPWVEKYIFPNSILPSMKQISAAVENLFVIEDLHNFSADYDRTLMEWYANFERNWPTLQSQYDTRFYRMWRYYLLASAATFRSRRNQLWQIVLSKRGVSGGYVSVR